MQLLRHMNFHSRDLLNVLMYVLPIGGFLAGLLYNIFFRAPDGGQQVAPA